MKNYEIEPYQDEDNSVERFEREEAYLRAKKRVDSIKAFYVHLMVYIGVNIFIIVMIVSKSNEPFFSFGTFSTAIFWGIGLFFHWVAVFGSNMLFGKDWEKRQMEKYMDDDKKRWE
ncbi:2TM domain-containing protein [Lacinutrix chionoecetis]